MIVRPNNVNALRLNPRTQRPEINPLRDMTRSWSQGTQRNDRVSLAANAVGEDAIEVQAERGLTGDFEITHFTSDHLGPYRVEFYVSGGTDKKLQNSPIHIDMVAGSAQSPFYLPVSIFLEARGRLHIKFTNLSASTTNQVRFVAHGRRFLDYENAIAKRELIRQFYGRNEHVFWLNLDDTSAALTADQTGSRRLMTVPGDADFEAEYALRKCTGPFRTVIREGAGNARPIVSGGATTAGLPDSHIFGTAMNPYRYTGDTAYFKRGTRVEAVFDDLSGAANTVEIALVGRLLYYPESPDRGSLENGIIEVPPVNPGPPVPVPVQFAPVVVARAAKVERYGKPTWL